MTQGSVPGTSATATGSFGLLSQPDRERPLRDREPLLHDRKPPPCKSPVDLAQARALAFTAAQAAARSLDAEPVILAEAQGRVLARQVLAPRSLPPFESSAMDGFAVRAADTLGAGSERPVRLAVVSESRAGHPSDRALCAGEAIAISTGAALPAGADAVVRVEDTSRQDGSVTLLAEVPAGRDVRKEGEDVQAGRAVLEPGARLGPAELGVLAAVGCSAPLCVRRPRVRVLTTGDELRRVGDAGPLRHGQIYDSSAHAIPALARQAGGHVVGVDHADDDSEALLAAAEECLDADLVLICGGISVGAHDHVEDTLTALGVEPVFAGVALKPGKPAWFGTRGKTLVFGLPGNPVSSIAVFVLLVAPALRALSGVADTGLTGRGRLTTDYAKPAGIAHALPCAARTAPDGTLLLTPAAKLGSHLLTSLLGASAFAVIEAERTEVRAGEAVDAEPIGVPLEPPPLARGDWPPREGPS